MNWKTHILIYGFVGMAMSILSAPGLISYQGRLTDNEGKPVTTAVDVTFTFWDAETGGTQLGSGFTDTDTVTPDPGGVYSTMIGDDPGNLIPASIFTGDSVWLNVNVGGEDLSPRKRITSVGYAMQSGGASEVKKVIRDFVVASGKSVDAGDVVTFLSGVIAKHDAPEERAQSEFNKGEIWYTCTARLTDTSFVIAYSDTANSDYGTVNIGTISGRTISWLGESVFNKGKTSHIAVASLSSTEFVVAYRDEDNANKGTARTGAISGGSISWGEESVFNDAGISYIALVAFNDTDLIVCFMDHGNDHYGTSRNGTVSAGTLSWGTKFIFNMGYTTIIKAVRLSDERIAIAFLENAVYYILIYSKTGFPGNAFVFCNYAVDIMDLTALSDNRIVVAYKSVNGLVRVGKVTAYMIYWGPEALFTPGIPQAIAVSALSDSQVVVAYINYYDDTGEVRLGTVSGNQMAFGPKAIFNSEKTRRLSALGLTRESYAIGFFNDGKSKTASASVGKSYGTVIGIADAAGTSGKSVPVILDGISDLHTGLEIGKTYYAGEDGTLVDDSNAPRIGKALSNRELLLDVRR